jgi:hypothetical protein
VYCKNSQTYEYDMKIYDIAPCAIFGSMPKANMSKCGTLFLSFSHIAAKIILDRYTANCVSQRFKKLLQILVFNSTIWFERLYREL